MSSATPSFCVIIKPDGVKRGLIGKIVHRFEKKGFDIRNIKMIEPDEGCRDLLEAHYIEHQTKMWFGRVIDFMMSGRLVVMEIVGDVSVARLVVGESVLPHKFPSGSIRGDYACSLSHNLVHCSENVDKGIREVALWFGNSLEL